MHGSKRFLARAPICGAFCASQAYRAGRSVVEAAEWSTLGVFLSPVSDLGAGIEEVADVRWNARALRVLLHATSVKHGLQFSLLRIAFSALTGCSSRTAHTADHLRQIGRSRSATIVLTAPCPAAGPAPAPPFTRAANLVATACGSICMSVLLVRATVRLIGPATSGVPQ